MRIPVLIIFIFLIIISSFSPSIAQKSINGNDGLQILRISSLKLPALPARLYADKEYCYVADRDSGLQIIDISDIADPKIAGSLTNIGNSVNLSINGEIAYIASLDSGFQAVDVKVSGNPVKLSTINSFYELNDLKISGQYAYLVDQESLYIVNIKNALNPIISGKYGPLFYSSSVELIDKYAYSLHCHYREEYCTLVIMDISNPMKPIEVSQFDSLYPWDQLVIENDYLYVAGFNAGLRIYDISSPLKPHLISELNTLGSPTNFCSYQSKIFLTEGGVNFNGVEIIDCVNPKKPNSVSSYQMENQARSLFVREEIIFVASDSLVILKYQSKSIK